MYISLVKCSNMPRLKQKRGRQCSSPGLTQKQQLQERKSKQLLSKEKYKKKVIIGKVVSEILDDVLESVCSIPSIIASSLLFETIENVINSQDMNDVNTQHGHENDVHTPKSKTCRKRLREDFDRANSPMSSRKFMRNYNPKINPSDEYVDRICVEHIQYVIGDNQIEQLDVAMNVLVTQNIVVEGLSVNFTEWFNKLNPNLNRSSSLTPRQVRYRRENFLKIFHKLNVSVDQHLPRIILSWFTRLLKYNPTRLLLVNRKGIEISDVLLESTLTMEDIERARTEELTNMILGGDKSHPTNFSRKNRVTYMTSLIKVLKIKTKFDKSDTKLLASAAKCTVKYAKYFLQCYNNGKYPSSRRVFSF